MRMRPALALPPSLLPEGLQLRLPGGQAIDPPDATVRVDLQRWASLARLKAGQVGALAEDYVEGQLELHGRMRDIMAAVVQLLRGHPVHSDTHWWTPWLARARSSAAHTPGRDAAQVQFHHDVCDAFYALWLDPRRMYSCAYFRDEGMNLTQAQEAKLDHICRKLMLRPDERSLDIGAGWGGLLLWAAEHHARTLWAWSDALESQLPEARRLLAQDGGPARAERTLRAYRLYLAGCAMSFKQGWIALHQVLATRPSGQVEGGRLRGSQSSYPFRRDYMYAPA